MADKNLKKQKKMKRGQTILIGSPVLQSPNILKLFLDSLLHLNRETFTVDYILQMIIRMFNQVNC